MLPHGNLSLVLILVHSNNTYFVGDIYNSIARHVMILSELDVSSVAVMKIAKMDVLVIRSCI